MPVYLVLITKDKDSLYTARMPDFPDVAATADSAPQAARLVSDMVHAAWWPSDGKGSPLPEPSPAQAVMADPRYGQAQVALLALGGEHPSESVTSS